MITEDPGFHTRVIREVLGWAGQIDLDKPPPFMGQLIHRRLREITGIKDPYRAAKEQANNMALNLFPELKAKIKTAADPLDLAARLAIAGNILDMAVKADLTLSDLRDSVNEALEEPFTGEQEIFRRAVAGARRILYLADNAGEIVFDRLLIEELSPARVTLAVRGFPVLNDATMADARAAGLHEIVKIIANGSDAPGTILEDCNENFCKHFHDADLILAKGQGNFETLSDRADNIFFLFKVKCPVIANHTGLPVGAQVVTRPATGSSKEDES